MNKKSQLPLLKHVEHISEESKNDLEQMLPYLNPDELHIFFSFFFYYDQRMERLISFQPYSTDILLKEDFFPQFSIFFFISFTRMHCYEVVLPTNCIYFQFCC
jgi:hypothetical protein